MTEHEPRNQDNKSWWVSWYSPKGLGAWTLYSPWWVSGMAGATLSTSILCAAIRAPSAEQAMDIVYSAYDIRPAVLEWRFVEQRDNGWTPFNDRFQKAAWMRWPYD